MASGNEMERFYKLTIRVLVSIIVLVGGFFGKLGVERALAWADVMEIRADKMDTRMINLEYNIARTAEYLNVPSEQIIWPDGLRPIIKSDKQSFKKSKLGIGAD